MKKKVKLYTYALSPYGVKVFWALIHKRIEFEIIYTKPYFVPEVSFTNKRIVPVLSIDQKWMLDSTDIIYWLDQEFPDYPLTGGDAARKQGHIEIEKWVNDMFIGTLFRHCIDLERPIDMLSLSYKLAHTMHSTTNWAPWYLRPLYVFALQATPFVRRHAKHTYHIKKLADLHATILSDLNRFIGDGPFLNSQKTISIADTSVYAQIYMQAARDLHMLPDFLSYKKVAEWARRVEAERDSRFYQPLYPNAPEYVAMIEQKLHKESSDQIVPIQGVDSHTKTVDTEEAIQNATSQ